MMIAVQATDLFVLNSLLYIIIITHNYFNNLKVPLQSLKFSSNSRPEGQAHVYPPGCVALNRQM